MIKQNDRVRVLDNNEVIEGIVSSTFESNGVDYIQIHGGGVYTIDEVTKVPQSPVSASNSYLEPRETPSVDTKHGEQLESDTAQREANEQYEWDKDDRPMEYREDSLAPTEVSFFEILDDLALVEEEKQKADYKQLYHEAIERAEKAESRYDKLMEIYEENRVTYSDSSRIDVTPQFLFSTQVQLEYYYREDNPNEFNNDI